MIKGSIFFLSRLQPFVAYVHYLFVFITIQTHSTIIKNAINSENSMFWGQITYFNQAIKDPT